MSAAEAVWTDGWPTIRRTLARPLCALPRGSAVRSSTRVLYHRKTMMEALAMLLRRLFAREEPHPCATRAAVPVVFRAVHRSIYFQKHHANRPAEFRAASQRRVGVFRVQPSSVPRRARHLPPVPWIAVRRRLLASPTSTAPPINVLTLFSVPHDAARHVGCQPIAGACSP